MYVFCRNVLGFYPRHTELYRIAFTHRSKSQEMGRGHRINNERLEYLGDAVLSSIVADYLYHRYPNKEEGFLTELRSKIVSRQNLNRLGNTIGLAELIQYDNRCNGEFKSKEGDGVEALVGAIYLDKGYKTTQKVVVNRFLRLYMDVEKLANNEWNFKSKLLDWGQQHRHRIKFVAQKSSLPNDKNRIEYNVTVNVDDKPQLNARASSIKVAEQLAAEKTYLHLQQEGRID